MHPSWEPIVAPMFMDQRFPKVRNFLKSNKFLPAPSELIFNAFQIELHRLRVVICGQDPYPDPKNSHGLAFSIPDQHRPYKDWPPSLQVIAQDICGTDDPLYLEKWFDPNLTMLMHQGVLLLNKALTVGTTSHMHVWEWFTNSLIENINEIENPIIFYFLGSPAKQLKRFVTSDRHYILESIHPAALAYDSNRVFDGKFREVGELYYELHGFQLHYTLPF